MVTNDDSDTSAPRDEQSTVLLADDDDAFRESLRIWLTSDGRWEVLEAASGDDVLDTLDESVDALVLDRRMPGFSGPEVVEQLDTETFDGAIIVVSAFKPDTHLNEDVVSEYLVKPIAREEFLDTLEQYV